MSEMNFEEFVKLYATYNQAINLHEQLYSVFAANPPKTLQEMIPVLCTFIDCIAVSYHADPKLLSELICKMICNVNDEQGPITDI